MGNRIYIAIFTGITLLLASCRKDEAQTPVPEPTKYELISGDYKVYDTLGNYLYDMNINYIQGLAENGIPRDTVVFENFDGEFNFRQPQGYNPSNPELFIQIGNQDTLYDTQQNRWRILFEGDSIYDKVFKDDTIRMIFHKTNINYWIEDAVPYYDCYCKQIAVKQH